jgi:hypothetical protein
MEGIISLLVDEMLPSKVINRNEVKAPLVDLARISPLARGWRLVEAISTHILARARWSISLRETIERKRAISPFTPNKQKIIPLLQHAPGRVIYQYIVYIVWRLIWQVLVLTVPVTSAPSSPSPITNSPTDKDREREATTTSMRSTYLALASLASIATPVLGQTFQRLGQSHSLLYVPLCPTYRYTSRRVLFRGNIQAELTG